MHNAGDKESPRVIWGKVLRGMKESGKLDMHAHCINIGTVSILQGKFCIISHSQETVDYLKDEQNFGDLVASFTALGYNYIIEVLYRPAPIELQMQKVHKLEEILGQKIKIID